VRWRVSVDAEDQEGRSPDLHVSLVDSLAWVGKRSSKYARYQAMSRLGARLSGGGSLHVNYVG
jgi:hypothetical protein